MSKVEQIEAELHRLSREELRQLRRFLDDLLEDELEFTLNSNPPWNNPSKKRQKEFTLGPARFSAVPVGVGYDRVWHAERETE